MCASCSRKRITMNGERKKERKKECVFLVLQEKEKQ